MQISHLSLIAVFLVGSYAPAAGQPSRTAPAAEPAGRAATGPAWQETQAVPRPPRAPKPPRPPRSEASGPEKVETSTRTFTVGTGATLVLSNIAGDISIVTGDASTIRVQATKRARGRTEAEAAAQLESTRVQFSEFGNRVEVRTVHDRTRNRVAVDYAVTVPPAGTIEVKSVSGTIVVRDVQGDVRVETISGDVAASGLAREGQLKSVSGDVEVTESAIAGDLSAHSVSGDVRASRVQARTIAAATVSGDVGVRDANCERAMVHSVSGSVEYAGALQPRGRYELKSHSGDVRLAVDGKVGFELDASSFSGAIRTDWPLTVRGTAAKSGHRRTLLGVHGDGSAQVSASTFSGSIEVVKR
jgi:DUF4097 and DUF4098 domain-containing protein YvlB